jgi:hypothetical protein
MKKLAVFILLLVHVNYFMFLPQRDEVDSYDANGVQTEDINSLTEYIRVILGYDTTPDDEDDDKGDNFTLVKICDYFFQQQVSFLKTPLLTEIAVKYFYEVNDKKPKGISYDIISPPPEA